jgi:hypothetical protein
VADAAAAARPSVRDAQLDRWIVAACIAYAAVFAAARLATVPALFYDDTLEVLRGQSWSLAYVSNQPPLYTWLYRAADLYFGNALLASIAVKYAGMAVAFALTFRAALATLGDSALAALATGSLLLSFDVASEMHRDFTQTVLMLALVSGTWLAVVPILRGRATIATFALLGVALGAGSLTKYSYIVFALALALALASDPAARARCADRRMLLALAIALALFAPHVIALQDLTRVTQVLFRTPIESAIGRRANGIVQLALSVVLVVLPMAALWWLMLRGAFRRAAMRDADDALLARVLWRWLAITLALFVAGILAAGISYVRESYMLPLLAPLSFLFFLRLRAAGASAVQLRRFAWVIGAGALAGLLITVGRIELEARTCSRCPPLRDYRPAAQAIARAGAAAALIVGDDGQAVANLLVWLPEARGWASEDPPAAIPPDAAGRACVLVWGSTVGASSASPLPDWARALVRTPPGVSTVQNVASPIHGLFGRMPRLFSLSFAVVPPGACILPAAR